MPRRLLYIIGNRKESAEIPERLTKPFQEVAGYGWAQLSGAKLICAGRQRNIFTYIRPLHSLIFTSTNTLQLILIY